MVPSAKFYRAVRAQTNKRQYSTIWQFDIKMGELWMFSKRLRWFSPGMRQIFSETPVHGANHHEPIPFRSPPRN
jgi:hypothetical protein